jgi:MFS family permease
MPVEQVGLTRRRAGLREIADGFRYVAMHSVLLVSFLIDIVAMAFGLPRAVFPELSQTAFGDPPGGGPALGLLYAAMAIGVGIAGLFSGWLHRVRRQGVAVTVSICIWGASVVAFGLTGSLWLAVMFLAVGGAADMVSSVYRNSMLQTVATDEMRGRMQGVFLVVVAGGPRLADLWHGPAAALAGPGPAVVGGGVAVIVLAVAVVRRFPQFWTYRAPA